MTHVNFLYGNDEAEFSKKLNFVKPQLMAFARASQELREKTMLGTGFRGGRQPDCRRTGQKQWLRNSGRFSDSLRDDHEFS